MNEDALLGAARAGDRAAFEALVGPHARALKAHCYRMLGSVSDADDATQETLLRAWKGLPTWEGRASLKNWLYRIATNASIDLASKRAARAMPHERAAPAAIGEPPGAPSSEPEWLEPAPPEMWEDEASPEALYSAHESVSVAFLSAIQRLPASQRATLLLRDVLGWSASEVAELLETSVAAVNSQLQRARATLGTPEKSAHRPRAEADEEARSLLARYVRAWESPEAFAAILRDEVILTMPPMPAWYQGRGAVLGFLPILASMGEVRFVPTMAAGGPAVAGYVKAPGERVFKPGAIHVVRFEKGLVAEIHAFVLPHLFARFGLPAAL